MKKFLLSLVALMAMVTVKAGEVTLWEGPKVLSGWNGEYILSDAGEELRLADAEVGDLVRFYLTVENVEDWQFKVVEGHWGDNDHPYGHFAPYAVTNEDGTPVENSAVVDLTATPYVEFALTETILERAYTKQWWGGVFIVQAPDGVTLEKVTLVKEGEIPTWEEVGKTIAFDEEGVILSSEFNGYTDDAHVEFTFTTTGSAGFVGWGAGSLGSLALVGEEGSKTSAVVPEVEFAVKGDGETTVICKLGVLKEALNAVDEYGRYGIIWNIWGFGDGACTNTRVSVVIKELNGATGETYLSPDTQVAHVYAIGGIEGSSWDPSSSANELAYDAKEDVYVGFITITEDEGWFAFSTTLGADDSDWDGFKAGRILVSKDWGTLNETATFVQGPTDDSFKLPKGYYQVVISLTNKTILFTDASGVSGLAADAAAPAAYYSISGARLAAPAKGVNVVKYTDGSVRKVLVK